MTIAHRLRRSSDFDLHGSTETSAYVHGHGPSWSIVHRERVLSRVVGHYLGPASTQLNDRASALLDTASGIREVCWEGVSDRRPDIRRWPNGWRSAI